MLSRIQISALIALAVCIWTLTLLIQGKVSLSSDMLMPFGIVIGCLTGAVLIFDRYLWDKPFFKILMGKNYPNLNGTWEVQLKSSWKENENDHAQPPIDATIQMKQSASKIHLSLKTKESESHTLIADIVERSNGTIRILCIYQADPKVDLRPRNPIHYGAMSLEWEKIKDDTGSTAPSESTDTKQTNSSPSPNPHWKVSGYYWTDRKTTGTVKSKE